LVRFYHESAQIHEVIIVYGGDEKQVGPWEGTRRDGKKGKTKRRPLQAKVFRAAAMEKKFT